MNDKFAITLSFSLHDKLHDKLCQSDKLNDELYPSNFGIFGKRKKNLKFNDFFGLFGQNFQK